MVTKLSVKYDGEGIYTATTPEGFMLTVDKRLNAGSTLLFALGRCCTSTLLYITEKMRSDLKQNITSIRAELIGETTPEPTDYYNKIHVKFVIEGKSIDRVKLEKAIKLVPEYCTISLTVDGKADIDWSYELVE
jgi:putative redox protein